MTIDKTITKLPIILLISNMPLLSNFSRILSINHKRELCKQCHEKKDYQGIGERDEKCRNTIVNQRSLFVSADVHLLGGVCSPTINAKRHQ